MDPHAQPWRERLYAALVSGDREAVARTPKTDLHCHALLSAPLQVYADILGNPPPVPPAVFGSFKAFADYIGTYLLPALTGREAVRRIIRAAFEHMANDNIVYAEISFDLLLPEFIGVEPEAFAELIAEECAQLKDRTIIAPEVGIARPLPADQVERRLRPWLQTGIFRSVDLYDDETVGNVADFAPLYRLAKDHGLKLKAHAGELLGPEFVRLSVEVLELDAVQHGVRAAEDSHVTDFLAARGTTLHVCPTSNYSLGVVDSLESHPARQLHDRGVKLTVNSDDYTLFGASVSDELLNLQRMGFDAAAIVQVVANGLEQMPQPARATSG